MYIQPIPLRNPPLLEEQIRILRRCPVGCPMVKTLDQRVMNQRDLVEQILKQHNLTIQQIRQLLLTEINQYPIEIQLCYHILRDCDYIDSLR